jgi:hypothetical protein
VESRGVEPRRRVCKTQLQSAGVPDSDRGGSRTHTHQALNLTPLPVGVPGHRVADPGVEPGLQAYETRTGAGPSAMQSHAPDSNRAAEVMTLGRAPARVQSSGDGGIRTHIARLLRPRPATSWATSPCEQVASRKEQLARTESVLHLLLVTCPLLLPLTRAGIEPALPA